MVEPKIEFTERFEYPNGPYPRQLGSITDGPYGANIAVLGETGIADANGRTDEFLDGNLTCFFWSPVRGNIDRRPIDDTYTVRAFLEIGLGTLQQPVGGVYIARMSWVVTPDGDIFHNNELVLAMDWRYGSGGGVVYDLYTYRRDDSGAFESVRRVESLSPGSYEVSISVSPGRAELVFDGDVYEVEPFADAPAFGQAFVAEPLVTNMDDVYFSPILDFQQVVAGDLQVKTAEGWRPFGIGGRVKTASGWVPWSGGGRTLTDGGWQ